MYRAGRLPAPGRPEATGDQVDLALRRTRRRDGHACGSRLPGPALRRFRRRPRHCSGADIEAASVGESNCVDRAAWRAPRHGLIFFFVAFPLDRGAHEAAGLRVVAGTPVPPPARLPSWVRLGHAGGTPGSGHPWRPAPAGRRRVPSLAFPVSAGGSLRVRRCTGCPRRRPPSSPNAFAAALNTPLATKYTCEPSSLIRATPCTSAPALSPEVAPTEIERQVFARGGREVVFVEVGSPFARFGKQPLGAR